MNSKELKSEAREKLKNKWSKIFSISLFYTIITIIVNYIAESIGSAFLTVDLVSSLLNLIGLIFLLPLSFGITASIIKLMRDENISVTDFINIGFQNISNTWKVILNMFLKLLIPFIIFTVIIFVITYFFISNSSSLTLEFLYILFIVIAFAFIIFSLIIIIPYALSMFVLYDNSNKTGKEIINMSADLMNGNKLKYIYLILSFLGWYILFYIILGILNYFLPSNIINILSYAPTVLITPYITATQFNFYESLKGEEKEIIENLEDITE